MNPLFEAAAEVQAFLQGRGWRFAFIGGLATLRWGAPRATQDVDLTLFAGLGEEERYVQALLSRFRGRIPDAEVFALRHRVLLLLASNGVAVDLALGGIPFEEEAVRRATPFEFAPGAALVTCSAEDLVVLKAFADRERDWGDIQGVLVRQGRGLDWDRIRRCLAPLAELKGTPEVLERLERLRREVEAGPPATEA